MPPFICCRIPMIWASVKHAQPIEISSLMRPIKFHLGIPLRSGRIAQGSGATADGRPEMVSSQTAPARAVPRLWPTSGQIWSLWQDGTAQAGRPRETLLQGPRPSHVKHCIKPAQDRGDPMEFRSGCWPPACGTVIRMDQKTRMY